MESDMADIRKSDVQEGRDRAEAMKQLRTAMREKNECLQEQAHCDNARRAIIDSMRPLMKLDREYFQSFFKSHQEFAARFNDYKYVEELCTVVCAVDGWVSGPGDALPAGDDPYAQIAWIGGLNLHTHASLYFGFSKKEMLRCFQLVQEMKTLEIESVTRPYFEFPEIRLRDSEDWMLYYTAAVTLKFREAVYALDQRRGEFGISEALRDDILGAIKSTYWWRYMMMARVIEQAAAGLPPDIRARVEAETEQEETADV
jgi:hypothetical protein